MSVKAFELVPAIERLKLLGDKTRTSIECIECCGKNLYLGTSDCFVFHFLLEEKTQENGKITYQSEKQSQKYLALKKPIQQLKAASALTRILVLCDNQLSLLNMFNLEPILSGAKARGITSFSVNENPQHGNPFSIEIAACTRKKVIQIYIVTEDRMTLMKDVTIPDMPLYAGIDAHCVCVAMETRYILVNYETNQITELFPLDSQQTIPVVKRVGKEEFLLTGPSAIGMFVTSAGISTRPPLKWSDDVLAVSYTFPYVVAMDTEFLTVHSVLDQQQKQSIPFHGGAILGDYEGKMFVASRKDVYSLVPLPIEKQVQALLSDKRVEEALNLAENYNNAGMGTEKFQKLFCRFQQQAGFIEFSQCHFDEAKRLFKDGKLDVRELISLYPSLLPSSSEFRRSVPPLHDFADINQITRGAAAKRDEYNNFLQSYLEELKATDAAKGIKPDVDTALLKLYAMSNPDKLTSLLSDENHCAMSDSIEALTLHQRYYAQGLLLQLHGEHEKALAVWTELVDGSIHDDTFPGFSSVVQYLANLSDHELVWRYVEWCLQKDPEVTVQIFTDRPDNEPSSERMRPETIIDYLHAYPKAVIRYLEYLVFQKKLEKETYHTHLAVLYLNEVLQLRESTVSNRQEVDLARSKLRHMLQFSNIYRVQLILGKVKETDMYAECAILYGKLEEHDKALRILVLKLQDYGAAEHYCDVNSKGKDLIYRRKLFQILLGVYLDPMEGKKDSLIAPAISLLNSEVADFDTVRVLQLIPESWSVGIIKQFLSHSIENNMHTVRMKKIQNSLARFENLQLKAQIVRERREPIFVSEETICQVCHQSFHEPVFVRYPNGVVAHTLCARNKTVCPVTGRLFSVNKPSTER